jgi:ADP-ribosyl-[dinitrogen reductase] hydrolase
VKLSRLQHDRSSAVLLGMACGDALGAGYADAEATANTDSPAERAQRTPAGRLGRTDAGFPTSWGEWTDYTALAVPVATAAADGLDLDAGPTIKQLSDAGHRVAGPAGLFRSAPVALAYLHDPEALGRTARTLAGDTADIDSADIVDTGDAAVLWAMAIRHSVLEGESDLRVGLDAIPAKRRSQWAERIRVAESRRPGEASGDGSAGSALQDAWSSIVHTDDTDASQYRWALDAAVRADGDAPAVTALAGGLLAARWGLAAVPSDWRRMVRGRPGLRGADLVRLSVLAAHGQDTNDAGERESFRLHVVT